MVRRPDLIMSVLISSNLAALRTMMHHNSHPRPFSKASTSIEKKLMKNGQKLKELENEISARMKELEKFLQASHKNILVRMGGKSFTSLHIIIKYSFSSSMIVS